MKIYMSNIENIKNISDLETKLSESDMLRYKNFSNNTRKLQYLLARTMIKDIYGEDIIINETGRPIIKSGFVSIAHKDNWVVVAISDTRVGIDIENTDIVRDFIGQSELLGLPKPDDKLAFYKNFVRFEAEFKYGEDTDKTRAYFYIKDNYLIGVCSAEKIQDIKFILPGADGVQFIGAE